MEEDKNYFSRLVALAYPKIGKLSMQDIMGHQLQYRYGMCQQNFV